MMVKLSVLVALSVFICAKATTPCCKKANILNSHLAPSTRRRLGTDHACTVLRAANIETWPENEADQWITQGGAAYLETDFTRFVYDLGTSYGDVYWSVKSGSPVAKNEKVIVMTVIEDPSFATDWDSAAAQDPGAVCDDGKQWKGKDMALGLVDKAAYFVVLAHPDVLAAWETWKTSEWDGLSGDCGTGCNVVVGTSNGDASFISDVHPALSTFDRFATASRVVQRWQQQPWLPGPRPVLELLAWQLQHWD